MRLYGNSTVAGIDYISLSYEAPNSPDLQSWVERRLHSVVLDVRKDNRRKTKGLVQPMKAYGYTGLCYRGVTVAYNPVKHRILETVAGETFGYSLPDGVQACTINRVDLAVDVTLGVFSSDSAAVERVETEIASIRQEYVRLHAGGKGVWGRRKITSVSTAFGGTTLYVGSRASERFLRIYNKAAELRDIDRSPTLEAVMRIELELTGRLVRELDVEGYLVSGALHDLIFDHAGRLLSEYEIELVGYPVIGVTTRRDLRPKEEKTLAWVRSTVMPSLIRLARSGFADELQAMGLILIDAVDKD